jgi:hypothetical protein
MRGLGALGLELARWMVTRCGVRHLTLVSRRGEANPAAASVRAELASIGGDVAILRADLTDAADVRRLIALIAAGTRPLLGVFHCSGLLDDGVIRQMDWPRMQRVLAPKVVGAWLLHEATRDLALDHFVLFSSVLGLMGSAGQANYAAANTVLDAIAKRSMPTTRAEATRSAEASSSRLVAVDIDRRTLQALGDWPIPRAEIARLIERTGAAGGAAIALDIFFGGPDRRSSHTLADEISRLAGGEKYAAAIRQLPDSDAAFAAALARTPTVLGALAAPSLARFTVNPVRIDGVLDAHEMMLTDGFTSPHEPLADAALAIGVQSLFGEDGARVRRVPLLLLGHGILAPGLALEAARIAAGAAVVTVAPNAAKLSFGDRSAEIAEGAMDLRDMGLC